MPNYATNRLLIKGKKEFIDQIIGEKFSFKNTVPLPEDPEAIPSNSTTWYVSNWGVKWDAIDPIVRPMEDGKGVQVSFTTPWETPRTWLEKTSRKFPKLSFQLFYIDGEYPKCGKIVARWGDITSEQSYEEGRSAIKFIQKNFK